MLSGDRCAPANSLGFGIGSGAERNAQRCMQLVCWVITTFFHRCGLINDFPHGCCTSLPLELLRGS